MSQAALYTRQQLNIRDVANQVLAIAAFLPACRPYLRRYFCAIVQLPSDWIQVAECYQVRHLGPWSAAPTGCPSLAQASLENTWSAWLPFSSPHAPPGSAWAGLGGDRQLLAGLGYRLRLRKAGLKSGQNPSFSGSHVLNEENKNQGHLLSRLPTHPRNCDLGSRWRKICSLSCTVLGAQEWPCRVGRACLGLANDDISVTRLRSP